MAWDPTAPAPGAPLASAPVRGNFQALDQGLMAPMAALAPGQVLITQAGPRVAGVPGGLDGQALTLVSGLPTWTPDPVVIAESADVAVSTGGTKTVTIPHGLGVVPTLTKVQLSLRATSGTLTATVSTALLLSADATSLTVRFGVPSAGAVGELVRVVAWVRR